MRYTFDITYLPCQSCVSKIHCDDCSGEVKRSLMRLGSFDELDVDIKQKYITASTDELSEDDLLDAMEAAGIFA